MRVAFMFYGPQQPELARRMVASVRQHMPHACIVQLTDSKTRSLDFVDEVRRIEGSNYAYLIQKHMAALPEPFIRLDYDMLIQGDLTHILDDTDLAFNEHGDPVVTRSDWGKKYPLATCVWGARKNGRAFAELFRKIHLESGDDDWLGLVPSVNKAAQTCGFRVKTLPGHIYNYTPKDRNDKPKDVLVLHYKGRRKDLMVDEGQEDLVKADRRRISQSVKGYQFES